MPISLYILLQQHNHPSIIGQSQSISQQIPSHPNHPTIINHMLNLHQPRKPINSPDSNSPIKLTTTHNMSRSTHHRSPCNINHSLFNTRRYMFFFPNLRILLQNPQLQNLRSLFKFPTKFFTSSRMVVISN